LTFLNQSQIALGDYASGRDVQTRLLMASWTRREVAAMDAILQSPQVALVEQVAEQACCSVEEMEEALTNLAPTGLFQRRGTTLTVDKDLRRYYETQMRRFEEDFEAGLDYLQSLLKHIPLQTLLSWYAIPRTADQVFEALMEKYLPTPKLFRNHLLEVGYDNPIVLQVAQMAYDAPDFQVTRQQVCEKFNLTHHQFQELALYLEFNFMACLAYTPRDDQYDEVITPFWAWREYLQFLRQSVPAPLNPSRVEAEPVPRISLERATEKYRSPEERERYPWRSRQLASDRNRRLVENSLEPLADGRWVLFDRFITGLTAPIGQAHGVALSRQGKRYFYARPRYSLEEVDYIRQMVLEWLAECGIVQTGTHDGSTCFRITEQGKTLLGFES
jgi:predicted transcriptional regulator